MLVSLNKSADNEIYQFLKHLSHSIKVLLCAYNIHENLDVALLDLLHLTFKHISIPFLTILLEYTSCSLIHLSEGKNKSYCSQKSLED